MLARWSLTWPYIIGQGMRATEAMGGNRDPEVPGQADALQVGEGADPRRERRPAELGAGAEGEGREAGDEGLEGWGQGFHGLLRRGLPGSAGVVISKK